MKPSTIILITAVIIGAICLILWGKEYRRIEKNADEEIKKFNEEKLKDDDRN